MNPLSVYHDPIVEWLEESYLARPFAKNKNLSFFMFSNIEIQNGCFDMRVYHDMSKHNDASKKNYNMIYC